MDSASSSHELKMLADELAQGMEKAMQLRLHLCSTTSSQAEDLLLQRIISTFEKALYILKWNRHAGQADVEPSISVDGSPRSENMIKNPGENCDYGVTSKKRKLQPTWIEQVKVNSDNGLEGPRDDGYSWRKYGQKDILGSKHPRSYYRCTYRAGRNCWATKQVQRSDEDPTLFEITYKGTHTCNQINNAFSPTSPEKLKRKQEDSHCHQLELQNQKLMNLKANLRVDTEGLDIQEMPAHFSFPSTFACYVTENHSPPISALADDNHLGTYSSLFYSPASSESNFFSDATYQMINYGGAPMQNSETDISAHASATNSPIGLMEFSIDPLNMSGFLT